MTGSLPTYPAYKDSGVEWLGDIPAHWEVRRLKHLATFNPSRSISKYPLDADTIVTFLPMESISENGSIDNSEQRQAQEVWQGYTYFERGDVIQAKITPCFENGKGAWLHDLATQVGFGTTEIIVMRARENVIPLFLYYLTYHQGFRKIAEQFMTGTAGQKRVPVPFVKNYRVACPDREGQAAIVRFLNVSEKRIRRYIRAKQKLIALLNEQKQAIIQQAVTRGFDPNVPMKDSGVEWLGEIPAHWEVKPAKRFYREIDIRSTTGQEELLSVSHITGVTPRSQKNVTMFKAKSYIGSKVCKSGDLVINTMWAWMGAMGVSQQTGIVSPSYGVYRPLNENDFLPEYSDYLLRTRPYVSEYICRSTGIRSSRLRLYPDEFLRIPLVQPRIEEQQDILDFLEHETESINKHLVHVEHEIDLINEYRTRLIADVVTGKVDVRRVAFALPEDFDDDALDDEELDEEMEELTDSD